MEPQTAARRWLTAAMVLPPLAWMTFEYGLAVALWPMCERVGHGLGLAWGAGALCACFIAAFSARHCIRLSAEPPQGASVTAWMGKVALIGSGFFALAITFQSIATLIVPSCAH
jgi:hypothetical protein